MTARLLTPTFAVLLTLALPSPSAPAAESNAPTTQPGRWSRTRANRWYARQGWLCGFNYIPATAINYTEMWQGSTFDPKTIDAELALAQDVGFNCLRVVLQYLVWEDDPDGLKKRMGEFMAICRKRGLRVMWTLFDDCAFGPKKDPYLGKQADVIPGWYAHDWSPSPGHSRVADRKAWEKLRRYVTDVIGRFRDDKRVLVWDLYNEPTNAGMGNRSLPLVEAVFRWARTAKPSQPLTVGKWNGNRRLNEIIFRESDILTFHHYGRAKSLKALIAGLKKHGRPVICTEWMARTLGSLFRTHLPIFVRERVGCMHWGLVNGKTQTHYPWGSKPGAPEPKVWFVDLFRKDHKPYDPKEIEVIKKHIKPSKGRKGSVSSSAADSG